MPGPHKPWRDRPASPPRRARIGRGFTQAQLAALTGISISTISMVETTGRGSATVRARLAAVLGVPVHELRGVLGGGKFDDPRQVDFAALLVPASASSSS